MYVYNVNLDNKGVWAIEGIHIVSLLLPLHGGGPYIQIDGNTGIILEVSHTK
jgi:hypothetical protein